MFRPGQEVGNYRVEGLVGRGGQGIVYRAVHVRLGTQHAVKMLLADVGLLRERLLEEGRIQARLKNPHVVPVTDVVEVDGALGLVAEYVPGAPLDAWIAAEDPSMEARLGVYRDLCAGVAAAHAARIVHRDLKPGNVLVETRDGRPFARVTDFGVAKVLDDARGRLAATLPGMAVGTPGYMAPEQLRDAATVDARADVFALGCLLHELVAGARAFPESELAQYAFALETRRRATIDSLDGVPRATAERVEATIAACLAHEATARPPDAAAVLAMLDGAPRTWVERVPKSTPRTPTAVPLAAPMGPTPIALAPAEGAARPVREAAAVERTGSVAGSGPAVANAPAGEDDAEDVFAEPTPSRSGGVVLLVVAAAMAVLVAGVAFAMVVGQRPGEELPTTTGADAVPEAPDLDPAPPSDTIEGASKPTEVAADVTPPRADRALPEVERPERRAAPSASEVTPPPETPPLTSRPTADTPPRAAQPATGRVVAHGDGELVALVRGDTSVSPAAAPPGHYTVRARFGAEGTVEAGTVAVQAGVTTHLRCDAVFSRCVPVTP